MAKAKFNFADSLLTWFDQHGRHDLPWQQQRSLYRVWVSEIMLQQTQVKTVIPYYRRFMQAFPDLKALAAAPLGDVLVHWAGLGYYTRARNLHKAAQAMVEQHQGRFPEDYEQVLALPGIGPSTAGAVLAQALDQRHVILDGNVKRVLARYHAVEGWPGETRTCNTLWRFADEHTPARRVADYTQAIMDLGATVCTRSSPDCDVCPVQAGCVARQQQLTGQLPTPRPRKSLPVRTARLLLVTAPDGSILLEKRPPSGIWGGLWSLPEVDLGDDIGHVCEQRWGFDVVDSEDGDGFRHTFSHYHFDITPCRVRVSQRAEGVREQLPLHWLDCDDIGQYALPAPVARLLRSTLSR